ncbi:SDR family NAD(P)-dependent oxidoreductase [Neorhizobium sp. P12A]|uniref:SDR family oxidoreductase n=1 Tax=Neorhizobium sp. P12A TaxID=2268027 RepID=UPI0011EDACD7|nr:SDR family NAD(P)-dependent oxidoreductase [Neorhizobium sp. P12A]KAA0692003.1 SDR family NAD(P)-dependent oxidoreductase [Neorhizobium sp. P12A]
MKLTGNTILIVGGTSGIGKELAKSLHALGNRVIVAGRRRGLLNQMIADHPGMSGIPVDVNDPVSLANFAFEVRTRFPMVNVLFANAGISRSEDMTSKDWNTAEAEHVIETNILGVLRVIGAILPMLKAKEDAAIVATSSSLAFMPRADFPTYCASKAFLHSWLQSLRHQLRHDAIEVLELAPPYVRTELTGAAQAADPRAVAVDDYVAQVIELLERQGHPRGEVLLQRDLARRWAERDGTYDEIYAAMNAN